MPATRLSGRVVERLTQAEACEPNPHYRDDLQIARLTVHYAATGEAVLCPPHVLASYAVLGLHPEKVWPAIEARRKALMGPLLEVLGAPQLWREKPPKKAAQSVKLWAEKTNGARAINSRADTTLLRDNTISVPMAAPSIAALFPNSREASSAKTRQYTLDEIKRIVGYSGAPDPVCALTISALRARGEWPNHDGPATPVLSVAIIGMMFEGVCCRRTVQRRIKRAVQLGYWRLTRGANCWTDCPKCGKPRNTGKCDGCKYQGRSKNSDGKWTGEFMRVPAYEFDIQKFSLAPRCREIHPFEARTYAEYKQRNVTEMPSRKPAQPDKPDPPAAPGAPIPERARPAAEQHRGERSSERISRDARQALFNAYVALKRSGMTHEKALGEVVRQFKNKFSPDDVEFALKIVGHKNGQDVTLDSPAETRESHASANCGKCGGVLVQNFGPGPRLKCPQCSADSS